MGVDDTVPYFSFMNGDNKFIIRLSILFSRLMCVDCIYNIFETLLTL